MNDIALSELLESRGFRGVGAEQALDRLRRLPRPGAVFIAHLFHARLAGRCRHGAVATSGRNAEPGAVLALVTRFRIGQTGPGATEVVFIEGRRRNSGYSAAQSAASIWSLIAQRRPETEPRLHQHQPCAGVIDDHRSTKAGVETPATRWGRLADCLQSGTSLNKGRCRNSGDNVHQLRSLQHLPHPLNEDRYQFRLKKRTLSPIENLSLRLGADPMRRLGDRR